MTYIPENETISKSMRMAEALFRQHFMEDLEQHPPTFDEEVVSSLKVSSMKTLKQRFDERNEEIIREREDNAKRIKEMEEKLAMAEKENEIMREKMREKDRLIGAAVKQYKKEKKKMEDEVKLSEKEKSLVVAQTAKEKEIMQKEIEEREGIIARLKKESQPAELQSLSIRSRKSSLVLAKEIKEPDLMPIVSTNVM